MKTMFYIYKRKFTSLIPSIFYNLRPLLTAVFKPGIYGIGFYLSKKENITFVCTTPDVLSCGILA